MKLTISEIAGPGEHITALGLSTFLARLGYPVEPFDELTSIGAGGRPLPESSGASAVRSSAAPSAPIDKAKRGRQSGSVKATSASRQPVHEPLDSARYPMKRKKRKASAPAKAQHSDAPEGEMKEVSYRDAVRMVIAIERVTVDELLARAQELRPGLTRNTLSAITSQLKAARQIEYDETDGRFEKGERFPE
jgi:hypothetical protein